MIGQKWIFVSGHLFESESGSVQLPSQSFVFMLLTSADNLTLWAVPWATNGRRLTEESRQSAEDSPHHGEDLLH